MQLARAVIVDTETTGLDEPQVIELAFSRPFTWAEELVSDDYGWERYKPSKPITPGAMAAHNIIEADLETYGPSPHSHFFDAEYLIGHNVDYDWKVLGSQPNIKRICTLELARLLYEDTDSHSLRALMYYFYEPVPARNLAKNAHSAAHDCGMTFLALREIMTDYVKGGGTLTSWEDLWRASEDARIPRRLTFGKHGPKDGKPGLLYSEAPGDYLDWMLKQDFDEYTLTAARRALRARGM